MGAELKYTDRDVRENEDFQVMVYKYLDKYDGEFEFLVSCKQRAALGMSLTVGMMRGVLNCMRTDPRLPFEMPDPMPQVEAEVIQMFPKQPKRKKKGKKSKRPEPWDCPLMKAGIFHHHNQQTGWRPDGNYMKHCSGLYRINRETNDQKARIHEDVLYVAGKSPASILLHKPAWAYTRWRPPAHKYGWSSDEHWWRSSDFELIVKLGCKHPSWLTKPILLRQSDVDEYHAAVDEGRINKETDMWKTDGKANPTHFKLCKRCFPDA